MLHDLKLKIETWTPEMADQFHNHIPRVHPRKGGYVWPTAENGFYHWGPDAVDFYRHDGMIFSMQEKWYEQDWECHQLLWDWSQEYKDFRISQPVRYEQVEINGNPWFYTEIQYPDKDIGYPKHFEDLLLDPYTTVKGYIDDITVLMKYFRRLATEYNYGYPSKVKLGNRIWDNQGYFWKDIKYWNNAWTPFFDKHVGEVQKIINRLPHNKIDPIHQLADYAREQWTE